MHVSTSSLWWGAWTTPGSVRVATVAFSLRAASCTLINARLLAQKQAAGLGPVHAMRCVCACCARGCREMVGKIAQEGYLLVTWANWHYWDFVQSWVAHVQVCAVYATCAPRSP